MVKKILSDLNLKSFALVEFVLLILLVVMIPWSWKYALWVVGLLVLNTVAKCIAEKRIGNSLLTKWGKWSLILVVLLVGWYAMSMLWTADRELGGEMLTTKLSMLALVGVFLCSDMSYGDRRHFRIVMYAFVFSLTALFLTRMGVSIHKMIADDKTFAGIIGYGFDTKRHHAYVALYGMVALWWLYREFMEEWKRMPMWMKVVAPVCAVALVADVIFVNSRAGILVLWMSAVLIPMHIFFVHKRRGMGLLWLVILVGGLSGIFALMPDNYNRVAKTAKEVVEGNIVVENVKKDKDKEKEESAVTEDSVAVAEKSDTATVKEEAVEQKEEIKKEEKEAVVEKKESVKVEEKKSVKEEEKKATVEQKEEKAIVAVEEKDSVVEMTETDSTAVTEEKETEKKEEVKQSDARFTIWKVALMVAKDEWVKGTGIGDRADEMEKKYKELGWEERRQNAHNQYLDTLVSTGILGLVLLLLMFLIPLRDALKQKSLVLGALVMVMAFNMLFETMFDRQMGLLFWGVMIGLLSMETAKNVSMEEAGIEAPEKEEMEERK